VKDSEHKLPSMRDPEYKKNFIQRVQMRKTNVRDLVFMSHLSSDRNGTGKFKSEAESKKYQLRHFTELKTLWQTNMTQIREFGPS